MAAYIVIIREETIDPAELQIYAQMAPAGLVGFPVSVKALYGKNELIEGDGQPEGIPFWNFQLMMKRRHGTPIHFIRQPECIV